MKKSLKVLFTVLSITSFLGGCTINYNYNYYTKSEENSNDENKGAENENENKNDDNSENPENTDKDNINDSENNETLEPDPVINNEKQSFIKVQGRSLYLDNQKYTIKSLGLGNDAYNDECVSIPMNHHTEESYKELSAMGFNTVRFYLTYRWFEDDNKPGVYKSEPFNWIDKNINWAEKYGMHILLDMHVPQGGYQSTGTGLALFTDKSNQTRLANLWKAIANRYKDCATIIGYDLVNEPQVPFYSDVRTSVNSWTALARECVSSIRSVDTNHVIFAERITGIRGGSNGWYDPDSVYAYPELDDDNVVYQGHYYGPFEFTHQRAYWDTRFKNLVTNYTSSMKEDVGEPQWIEEKTKRFDSESSVLPLTWKKFTYTLSNWNSSSVNKIRPAIKTGELGRIGSLYIDDVVFTKRYPDGREEEITRYTFDNISEVRAWYFGSEDKTTGEKQFNYSDGNNGAGCLAVSKTESASWITQPELISLEEECSYTMSFYAKFSGQFYSYASFGFDLYKQNVRISDTKASIENEIKQWKKYPDSKNKPLFIGEFGCINYCFEEGRGAEQYIKDVVSIFNENTCGYNYHDYHEENFGLHIAPSNELPSNNNLNKKLYQILVDVNKM